jgi:hypothetical protein
VVFNCPAALAAALEPTSDLDLIRRTVDTQIHGKPGGTTASWTNPNSGTTDIKLLRRFRRRNLQCEQVAYTLMTIRKAVEPEHSLFTSCLTPEGWQIARYSDRPYLLNMPNQDLQGALEFPPAEQRVAARLLFSQG